MNNGCGGRLIPKGFLCGLWLLVCVCVGTLELKGEVISKGQVYDLFPAPNYAQCTDENDLLQLTDGQFTDGSFWVQPGCVGWVWKPIVKITVDLEETKAISGVVFSTAAGRAGVRWPASIWIEVSDDGRTWYEVGDLVALSARQPSPGYKRHRFRAGVATHGRWVRFTVEAQGNGVFVDEIQVVEGGDGLFASERGSPVDGSDEGVELRRFRRWASGQVLATADVVGGIIASSASPSAIDWKLKLSELRADANTAQIDPEEFPEEIPINATHAEIFRLAALVRQESGHPLLSLWAGDPWAERDAVSATPTELVGKNKVLRFDLLKGEVRGAAIDLEYLGGSEERLQLSFENIPSKMVDGFRLFRVVHVPDRDLTTANAIIEVHGREGVFSVYTQPGLAMQFWLECDGALTPAGRRTGTVRVDCAGETAKLPLSLRVSELSMEDLAGPPLRLGGWDYVNGKGIYGVTSQNRKQFVSLLQEHCVTVPWATRFSLPMGRHDAQGRMIELPETEQFDEWLSMWPGASRYCVFLGVKPGRGNSPYEPGTDAFCEFVSTWAKFWSSHFEKKKTEDASELAILICDEPKTQEEYSLAKEWAQAIRTGAPDILLYADPRLPVDGSMVQIRGRDLCDVVVLNRTDLASHPGRFPSFNQEGSQIGLYDCHGPSRLLDPYSYYRLQPWVVHNLGGTWCGFWAFADNGRSSSWRDILAPGKGSHSPVYLDATRALPSKQLKAIRAGAQDFRYLQHADMLLTQPRPSSPKLKDAYDRIEKTLDGNRKAVVAQATPNLYRWNSPKDRGLADRVRLDLLDCFEIIHDPFAAE